jgi:hypothetical protein
LEADPGYQRGEGEGRSSSTISGCSSSSFESSHCVLKMMTANTCHLTMKATSRIHCHGMRKQTHSSRTCGTPVWKSLILKHRHEYKNDFAGEYFSISDGGTNSCLELDGAYWSHRSARSTALALIATLWQQSVVAPS